MARLRAAVPEFEPRFERLLAEEGPDVDPFNAASRLGDWLLERLLAQDGQSDMFERAFKAVEDLWNDRETQFGTELAGEIYEIVAGEALAKPYLPSWVIARSEQRHRRRVSKWWRIGAG